MSLPTSLLVACLVLVGVLVAGEYTRRPVLRAVSKTAASLAFVAFALAAGAAGAGLAGKLVVLGLVLSTVGDVALLSRADRWFRVGLVAFLIAHLAYIAAFVAFGLRPVAAGIALVPLAGVGWGVFRWMSHGLGRLRRPVIAYVAIITVMVACAVGAAAWQDAGLAASGGAVEASALVPWRLGLLGAAVLFYLSDLCVARDRFVAPGFDNRLVGLPLYYVAQLLFGIFASASW